MFSSKLATAVHILLYIEEYENEEKITSEVLSDTTGVNAVNIRKLLSQLKSAGLISVRAGIGGAYLAMPPEDISLHMIFNAVEEKDAELFRMHEHPNVNCPVGRTIKDVLDYASGTDEAFSAAKHVSVEIGGRKADKAAMVGSRRALALVTVVCSLGSNPRMTCSKMPLLRTPSLTRKSNATVIIPLFEKPSRHSLGLKIPAQSIITTQVNRMSPGFNLSAISAQIMNTRQKAT